MVANMPAAARLPRADALGAIGFAPISEPRTISVTPINLATFFSPNLAISHESGGLEVTRGRIFSTS
ncbi:hypothetical protein GCM10023194_57720 [Planotetraspora phitsanulokensis]|uniref:Uncharacterized protein n=1 Tax=Planotetraspora phitsanulokensis TaxID=575192 RepID=A0A8J3XNM1_9ACTN|nr:hypothetical protein Pph01_79810 [Planotetraspora phitsanulokensis]